MELTGEAEKTDARAGNNEPLEPQRWCQFTQTRVRKSKASLR